MAEPTEPTRYRVYLDYFGYMIDERSYRVLPAPLMGTRFATGRTAYSNLDFWQVGAMTDFTKGINQKFLVDPSQYYESVGIDVSREGELRLDKDLQTISLASLGDVGYVTARYRSRSALWLGTSSGYILKTEDGASFSKVDTGGGKIYCFYEMSGYIVAAKGSEKCWRILKNSLESWEECDGTDSIPDLDNLYFVMVESNYAYGMFNDGIRQSRNGFTWLPAPPDPLWSLPDSEGVALNAIPIPRGFLIGASRGLWLFTGGGSAINVWFCPEYTSANNFRGMDKFGAYGLVSVEGLGLFYTDGSGIYPTNLNWQEQPVAITSCVSVLICGYDAYALVSDGASWYLARSSMKNTGLPKYFWLIKKLTKKPCYLSAYSGNHVFVHYEDGTCQKYDKDFGPYQASGYLVTSLVDEGMVLLQKLYKSLDAIYSSFPIDTSVKLGYRLGQDSGSYTEKTFSGGSSLSSSFNLANPTLSTRIQIKVTLNETDPHNSPILTDLLWKYILEQSIDDATAKKTFHFTILAENELEKLDFDKEELELQDPRTAAEIVSDLWETNDKMEILNFVGADNINYRAFFICYVGTGSSCRMNIDRTNEQIVFTVDGVVDQTVSYSNLKITSLVATLSALTGYTCVRDTALPQNELAINLFPVNEQEIKGGAQVYYGTDIHPVIFNSQAPGQFNSVGEEGGSVRVILSLRES